MTCFRKSSIQNRLIGIILIVLSLTGTLGYSSFVYWYMKSQQEKMIELSDSVGLVFSQDFARLVLLNQISVASDITAKLKSFSSLKSLVLYNQKGEPVYQYSQDNESFQVKKLDTFPTQKEPVIHQNNLKIFAQATYHTKEFGMVEYHFKIEGLWDIIKRDLMVLIVLSVMMLFVSYVLAVIFAKRFTKPILNLVHFLEKIDLSHNIHERIFTHETNEFGKLYAEVNTMLDRIQSSQQEQKLAAVAFETVSGMVVTNAKQEILRVNKAFTHITGYAQDEVLGKTPALLNSKRHNKAFYEQMWQHLQTYHYWSGEIYNRHKKGDIYPEYLTIQSVLDEKGEVLYYVAAFLDLTLQKNAEAKIEYLNHYDSLTGLANRQLLNVKLQEYLHQSKDKKGILLSFDIDNFKLINDTLGHEFGDLLLQLIASRIKSTFSHAYLQVRLNADEFLLWFNLSTKDKTPIQTAETLAQELIAEMSLPYDLKIQTVNCVPSVGIVLFQRHHQDAAVLIQQADSALHQAKKQGNKQFSFFDKEANKIAKHHFNIYNDLQQAIIENQFKLLYQAQYDKEGKLRGAEALIRWEHPQKGVVSPLEFIGIAERTGLILPIGSWVLQTACEQLYKWQQDKKREHLTLSVNVSAKQFYEESFVEQIHTTMKKYGIAKEHLKLELTETLLVDNINEVIEKMSQLRVLGVQISLDDFGTGYSSLQYLQKLPLNQIKIDQSFVKEMLHNQNDVAIIKSILSLADAFGFDVIAEGVETKEHYEALKRLGCKAYQGYYFGFPTQASKLE